MIIELAIGAAAGLAAGWVLFGDRDDPAGFCPHCKAWLGRGSAPG